MPVKFRSEVEVLEEKFSKLAQEIYNVGSIRFQPLYPWVLIRVVPKEQKIGSIIAPDIAGDKAQNKPLWEGIVLETWRPTWKASKSGGTLMSSEFVRGDRVLFPHFAGQPCKYLDETKYRLLREWTYDVNGGVGYAKIHYDGDKKLKNELERVFKNVESVTLSGR